MRDGVITEEYMKKETLRLLLKIVLGVAIVAFIASIVGIYVTMKQYSDSISEYKNLEQYVSIDNAPAVTEEEVTKEIPAEESQADEIEEETVEEESLIDVDFDMDFESLKAINSDVIGWIYYEPIELSYPVVLDRGDDFYENYSFELEKNVAGAIFMDYACRSDFGSFNTIIYGHNMRNGTMFGSLKKLINDTSIIEANPYFYTFTEDKVFMYKIVCVYYTPAGSQTYNVQLEYTDDDKQAYVDYMNNQAVYRDEEFFSSPVTEDTRIATLSTCHGLHSGNRTVVHGVLVAEEER